MFQKLKVWAIEIVIDVEKRLKGKTGAQKKAEVIRLLDEKIKLPWYCEWVDNIVIGYIVDWACEKLNFLSDWDFSKLELDDVHIAELAASLNAPASFMVASDIKSTDVNKRIEELYAQYGIKPEEPPKPDEPTELVKPPVVVLPPIKNHDNQLSAHLTRNEIKCKCGCGFDAVNHKLVDTFEALREYVGKPIFINSGCRCPTHNKKIGGVANSAHMTGEALDMHVKGLSKRTFGESIKKAHALGRLPHLKYCYLIENSDTAVHIGVDDKKRKGIWGW